MYLIRHHKQSNFLNQFQFLKYFILDHILCTKKSIFYITKLRHLSSIFHYIYRVKQINRKNRGKNKPIIYRKNKIQVKNNNNNNNNATSTLQLTFIRVHSTNKTDTVSAVRVLVRYVAHAHTLVRRTKPVQVIKISPMLAIKPNWSTRLNSQVHFSYTLNQLRKIITYLDNIELKYKMCVCMFRVRSFKIYTTMKKKLIKIQ